MMEKTELIPEWKVREACEKCMKSAKHARYFNEAPPGAKQYIAFIFFETVFPNDLTEEVSDQCFTEMLQELNADDLLYLIAHETDPQTRDVFVERLAFLREQSAQYRKRVEKPVQSRERPPVVRSATRAAAPVNPPSATRAAVPANPPPATRAAAPANPPPSTSPAAPAKPPSATSAADSAYKLTYNAHQLDRAVAAWDRTWKLVCLALALIFILISVDTLMWYAISKGWLRVWRWGW